MYCQLYEYYWLFALLNFVFMLFYVSYVFYVFFRYWATVSVLCYPLITDFEKQTL